MSVKTPEIDRSRDHGTSVVNRIRPGAPNAVTAMTLMALLTAVANLLNYASSFLFSRVLEPVGFGELTSLLALAVVVSVPLAAAQTVIAERVALARVAGDVDRVRYLIRLAVGHVATIAALVTVTYIACIPLVMWAVDIREPGPVIALGFLIPVTFFLPVVSGVLQGLELYVVLGVLLAATAASRLIFGVPWSLLLEGGAGGAIAGQALGLTVVLVLVGWRYRGLMPRRGSGAARRGLTRRLDLGEAAASGAFIGFALLSNLDVLLVRLYLDGTEAGVYAALATIAKIVVFMPAAVAVIMVPRAARAHAGESASSLRVLRVSALITLGAAIAVAIPAAVAPDLVVSTMFGDDYESAVAGVLPALLAGSLLAMLYLVCVYSVTIRDERWVLLLVGGIALQGSLISLFHGTPADVMWAQAATIALVLGANELVFHSLIPRGGGAR